MQLVFFCVQPIKESAHAAPVAFSIDDCALLTFGELIESHVQRNLFRFAELAQFILGPFKLWFGPWFDCSFTQGQARIRNHQIEIETIRVAESLTRRTGAERIIEAEQTRLGSRVDGAVVFTFELLGETQSLSGTHASGVLLWWHPGGVRTGRFYCCPAVCFL